MESGLCENASGRNAAVNDSSSRRYVPPHLRRGGGGEDAPREQSRYENDRSYSGSRGGGYVTTSVIRFLIVPKMVHKTWRSGFDCNERGYGNGSGRYSDRDGGYSTRDRDGYGGARDRGYGGGRDDRFENNFNRKESNGADNTFILKILFLNFVIALRHKNSKLENFKP
uniref:ATP-dependent RNA helicase n=1 Tax=Heterorhabditis bacteriophora TaxID=37862 RepID=A0A1I7X685_HETBA